MAFTWDQRQLDWYLHASDFGSFHQDMAAFLLPYLRKDDEICDWGSGPGRLSLELAPHVGRITCIDQDQSVLASLEDERNRRGLANIRVIRADAASYHSPFDVSLMVFFGTPPDLMFHCLSQTRRLLIRVMKEEEGAGGRETLDQVERALKAAGCSYQKKLLNLEFGQPFLSLEDARGYLEVYPPGDGGVWKKGRSLDHLQATGRSDFPYYLPKEKKLAFLFIDPGKI